MINLVACRFPTIDPKLGVTLSNFVVSNKATLGQKVEDCCFSLHENINSSTHLIHYLAV